MVDDPVLAALDELTEALRENSKRNERALLRAERIRQMRAEGMAYTDIVSRADEPLIVEMLAENMQRLATSGGRLRREEARMLYREGLTMERIATLFGVTRQRISELLRDR